MQCLILAGGLGTRMRSISGDKPKALLPVGPHTFIDWQLMWLARLGVTQAIMSIGYGGELIQEHVEENKARLKYPEVVYIFDGPKFLGTGGAIKNAAPLLENDFVVTYGDSFLRFDVQKLWNSHLWSKLPVTFSIFENKDTGDKSNVSYRDGKLIKYDKFKPEPDMHYIDYGMLALNKKYFLENTPEGVFDLGEFLTRESLRGTINAVVAKNIFYEVGSPAGYKNFCELLASKNYDLDQLLGEI